LGNAVSRCNGRERILLLEQKDEAAVALDKIYAICGWAGLVLLILGVALQIVATLLPPTPLPPKA
jgi:hypothetical protein